MVHTGAWELTVTVWSARGDHEYVRFSRVIHSLIHQWNGITGMEPHHSLSLLLCSLLSVCLGTSSDTQMRLNWGTSTVKIAYGRSAQFYCHRWHLHVGQKRQKVSHLQGLKTCKMRLLMFRFGSTNRTKYCQIVKVVRFSSYIIPPNHSY